MTPTVYGVRSFNHLGDSIITAGAVHNVKLARPDILFRYIGHAPEVWIHNPDQTDRPATVTLPKVHYGSVPDERLASFGNVIEGFTRTLCRHLGIDPVPVRSRVPFAVLTEDEKAAAERCWRGAVLLNANGQTVSFSKTYPHWQEVIDALRGRFSIVQVGSRERRNISPTLDGVTDWRGRSEKVREFMGMVWACRGIISPPSALVNIAAAFGRPGVVVNGARELALLTDYPGMAHVSAEFKPCASGKDWACIALTECGQRPCKRQERIGGRLYAQCMAELDPLAIVEAVRRTLG